MRRTHAFPYHDEAGRLAFWKVRYAIGPSLEDKTFRYYWPNGTPGKPPGADAVLYRLPVLLRERRSGADLLWTEGERCSDSVSGLGYVATSHHQAAGHATPEQAEWLKGWKGHIYLVADRDVPGAVCVVRRYDHLRSAGVPARKVTIIKARTGKDARDHVEAGYSVEQFVKIELEQLRKVAARRERKMATAVRQVEAIGRAAFDGHLYGQPSGDEWRAFCPVHESPARSKTPSASVNFELGVWYCHACAASGVLPTTTTEERALGLQGWLVP